MIPLTLALVCIGGWVIHSAQALAAEEKANHPWFECVMTGEQRTSFRNGKIEVKPTRDNLIIMIDDDKKTLYEWYKQTLSKQNAEFTKAGIAISPLDIHGTISGKIYIDRRTGKIVWDVAWAQPNEWKTIDRMKGECKPTTPRPVLRVLQVTP